MTGKQSRIVKAAWDGSVTERLKAILATPRDWETYDRIGDVHEAYLAAKWVAYPRYDEQIAALRGEA